MVERRPTISEREKLEADRLETGRILAETNGEIARHIKSFHNGKAGSACHTCGVLAQRRLLSEEILERIRADLGEA